MGLKKAFDDAEKRGETRCSVCLSAVHSKEYHENAAQAPLATAPPEQADQLVERWEQIAEDGEGTPATDNFYFRCAMERCAAELKATFRATPSFKQDKPADQPQAASAGALSGLVAPIECLIAYHEKEAKDHVSSQWIYSNHMFAVQAYQKVLKMLAAHDQKVRAEVLKTSTEKHIHGEYVSYEDGRIFCECGFPMNRMAIRSLASGAVEKEK